VVVTTRNPEQVNDLIDDDRAPALLLDVTRPERVRAAGAAAKDCFQEIDALDNNADTGYFAAVSGRNTNVRYSAEEDVAVITCAGSQPEIRSGREAGVVGEGVLGSPPSNRDRPTTSPQAQPARPRITR
jgi:NAD(P)-dependent dehydrogenase (short-subunit alcohol dehydrogenase family)